MQAADPLLGIEKSMSWRVLEGMRHVLHACCRHAWVCVLTALYATFEILSIPDIGWDCQLIEVWQGKRKWMFNLSPSKFVTFGMARDRVFHNETIWNHGPALHTQAHIAWHGCRCMALGEHMFSLPSYPSSTWSIRILFYVFLFVLSLHLRWFWIRRGDRMNQKSHAEVRYNATSITTPSEQRETRLANADQSSYSPPYWITRVPPCFPSRRPEAQSIITPVRKRISHHTSVLAPEAFSEALLPRAHVWQATTRHVAGRCRCPVIARSDTAILCLQNASKLQRNPMPRWLAMLLLKQRLKVKWNSLKS